MERMTSGILEVPGTTRNRRQPSYLCRVTFDGLIRQISPLPLPLRYLRMRAVYSFVQIMVLLITGIRAVHVDSSR
jgi:hypothetical protein